MKSVYLFFWQYKDCTITKKLYFASNRRKESSDVNSLISALDTTLKFSEQRTSPELDQETQEQHADDPGGKFHMLSYIYSGIPFCMEKN